MNREISEADGSVTPRSTLLRWTDDTPRASAAAFCVRPRHSRTDEYRAENVFWVPIEVRWTATGDVQGLQKKARDPKIGKFVDDAMEAIEKENPGLKRVLPKDYASPDLDKARLGELIDLISTIGMGDEASRSKDILGRIYEYFQGKFANAAGQSHLNRPVFQSGCLPRHRCTTRPGVFCLESSFSSLKCPA